MNNYKDELEGVGEWVDAVSYTVVGVLVGMLVSNLIADFATFTN